MTTYEFGFLELDSILSDLKPGDEHGWYAEFEWLEKHESRRLDILTHNIATYGILNPILIGNDGRVWDGHHRLYIAKKLGIKLIPVQWVN